MKKENTMKNKACPICSSYMMFVRKRESDWFCPKCECNEDAEFIGTDKNNYYKRINTFYKMSKL